MRMEQLHSCGNLFTNWVANNPGRRLAIRDFLYQDIAERFASQLPGLPFTLAEPVAAIRAKCIFVVCKMIA